MARFKPYDANQSRLVPITLSEHIYEGSLEEAIHLTVEGLDLKGMEKLYHNDETGRPAINPKVLLKVILLAYARGMTGSRVIERSCRENVLFMALAGGEQPDHATIAAFVSALKGHIIDIFVEVLIICEKMDLLSGTHLSLDGLKLPSNASKEHSGTFKELKKKRAKLKGKLKELIREHRQLDKSGLSAQEIRAGKRAKQIKRIEKEVKRLDSFLKSEQPKTGKSKKEIQSNITDNQSAKMPTSHGVIQGYNAQAVVDDKHQIIVAAEAMSNGQDHDNLSPMLQKTKENLKAIGKGEQPLKGVILTADANYHNNKNIVQCEQEEIDAYIPDTGFRKRDERFKEMDRFKDGVNKPPKAVRIKRESFGLESFRYDEKRDCYICPQGNLLELRARGLKGKNKYYRMYQITDNSCENCVLRGSCLSHKEAKQRCICVAGEPITDKKITPSQRMQQKIDTPDGKAIYGCRIGNIEPVFGNMRYNKGMSRFTYRTKEKVDIQWLLYCLVHNLEKIAHYGIACPTTGGA